MKWIVIILLSLVAVVACSKDPEIEPNEQEAPTEWKDTIVNF